MKHFTLISFFLALALSLKTTVSAKDYKCKPKGIEVKAYLDSACKEEDDNQTVMW